MYSLDSSPETVRTFTSSEPREKPFMWNDGWTPAWDRGSQTCGTTALNLQATEHEAKWGFIRSRRSITTQTQRPQFVSRPQLLVCLSTKDMKAQNPVWTRFPWSSDRFLPRFQLLAADQHANVSDLYRLIWFDLHGFIFPGGLNKSFVTKTRQQQDKKITSV